MREAARLLRGVIVRGGLSLEAILKRTIDVMHEDAPLDAPPYALPDAPADAPPDAPADALPEGSLRLHSAQNSSGYLGVALDKSRKTPRYGACTV